MRILMCASEAPLPPLNGFRLQLSPVCTELARRHEVVVLAYRWPDQREIGGSEFELRLIELPAPSTVRRGLTWLTTARPLGAVTTGQPMADAARELMSTREFDVVHIAGWSLADLRTDLPETPAVLTALDAWHLNYRAKAELGSPLRRFMYRREARRVERFERSAYRGFHSVVVVSAQDAEALSTLDPAINLSVIPNGVDADHYAPRREVQRERDLVVFTGAMQWRPNARAAAFLAHKVFPLLRERRPEARLALVGRQPGAEVRSLAKLDGVEVTGDVPDVREWLWRAGAFACPMLSGTGIKNKLLEAMACEVPCVATPLACQGFAARHGEHLMIAQRPEDVADALAAVLEDPDFASRLGSAGRHYTVMHHSWPNVGLAYERLLGDAAAAGERRSQAAGIAQS